MRLEIYRDDLKHESRKVSCSRVGFEDLRAEAQGAVRVVGEPTFYEDDRSNYNVIYPPEVPG